MGEPGEPSTLGAKSPRVPGRIFLTVVERFTRFTTFTAGRRLPPLRVGVAGGRQGQRAGGTVRPSATPPQRRDDRGDVPAAGLLPATNGAWPTGPSERNRHWAGCTPETMGCRPQINHLFGDCTQFRVAATYRRKGQHGRASHALIRADLPNPRSVLERLVDELVEFHVEQTPEPRAQATPPKRLPELPPLAAAMSAEGHLLATLPPDARPPDMLAMSRVMLLVAWQCAGCLTGDHSRVRTTGR
jgi:hypothetical protein